MLCVKPIYCRNKLEHAGPEAPGEIEFTSLRGGGPMQPISAINEGGPYGGRGAADEAMIRR